MEKLKFNIIRVLFALALVVPQLATGQQIQVAEYFIDTDPGIGLGTPLTISASDTISQSYDIPATGLTPGVHQLYVRVKNNLGNWSQHYQTTFWVNDASYTNAAQVKIAAMEYYLDSDPGIGKGVQLAVTAVSDTVTELYNISLTGYNPGFHEIFFRAKNSKGIWTNQFNKLVYINEPKLVDTTFSGITYAFDNGTEVSLPATAQSSTLDQAFTIPTTGLSVGFHKLGIKSNTLGKSSLGQDVTLYVAAPDTSSPIVAAEYFIDTVPNIGNGTALPAFSSTDTLKTEFVGDITGKEAGVHKVIAVAKDARGRSSIVQAGSFTICDILPEADFKATFNASDTTVIFANTSPNFDGATVFQWDFDGNGTNDYTGSSNIHQYAAYGIYSVRLIAANSDVCRDTIIKVVVADPDTCKISAGFTAAPDAFSNLVTFTSASTGTIGSYYWDFGDGSSSTKTNPVKTYAKPGYYTVTLSINKKNSKCTDIYSEVVKAGSAACKAFYTYTVDNKVVTFDNQSLGSTLRYFWYFDDGSYSTEEAPPHTFVKDGIYNVSLSISNQDSTCSNQYVEAVQIGATVCDARFTYFVNSTELSVSFNSIASSSNVQFLWSFGDGGQSTLPIVSHKYNRAGVYTVSLVVYNSVKGCSDKIEKEITVGTITDICDADFIFQSTTTDNSVKFFDNSKGDIIGYVWNYEDGTIDAGGIEKANPSHSFLTPGFYNVCQLVVSSTSLIDMKCKPVVAHAGHAANCYADFDFIIDTALSKVKFLDKSEGLPNSWEWKFGDGNSATSQDPTNTFGAPGYYLVKLTIANASTNCSAINYKLVNIAKPQELKADFGFVQKTKAAKAGGYPVDFIGAGLGDQARLKWDFDDQNNSSETNPNNDTTTTTPSHEYQEGTYTVCYEVYDQILDEKDTVCNEVVVTKQDVAVGSATWKGAIKAYPNPFVDKIKITYSLDNAGMVDIKLVSLDGRVNQSVITNYRLAGDYSFDLNASSLPAGTYIVLLSLNNETKYYKLIVKK